jgi:hypothetical protein
LQKVAPSFHAPPTPSEPVVVEDVLFLNEPVLRSGRLLAHKTKVLYRVNKNNTIQTLTSPDLKFLKKVLGPDSLTYSASFSDPAKQKYIV